MTVVVRVDGLTDSLAAIRVARDEAAYRGTGLVAVMAYSANAALGAPAARPLSAPRPLGEERRLAEAALQAAVTDAVGAADHVELRAVMGLPGHAVVEIARNADAQLVVLGARKGRSSARLPGGVSQYVLQNAPCPVMVVPAFAGSA
jgi:nucleotide-binding universal stress UspA family protein